MGHYVTVVIFVLLYPCLVSCASSPSLADTEVSSSRRVQSLAPCSMASNCVCSEDRESKAWIAPLDYWGESDPMWDKAVGIAVAMGGKVVEHNDEYLHVVFTSLIMRFKDDLELRLCRENNVIHIRSASRVGRSDFGVNRRRVERLRSLFMQEGSS